MKKIIPFSLLFLFISLSFSFAQVLPGPIAELASAPGSDGGEGITSSHIEMLFSMEFGFPSSELSQKLSEINTHEEFKDFLQKMEDFLNKVKDVNNIPDPPASEGKPQENTD